MAVFFQSQKVNKKLFSLTSDILCQVLYFKTNCYLYFFKIQLTDDSLLTEMDDLNEFWSSDYQHGDDSTDSML